MRFSTTDFAPKDRLAAWCEVYGKAMCKQDIEPVGESDLVAEVVVRRLPGLVTMNGSRFPATYTRRKSQVDSDNLFVTIALAGTFEGRQLGRVALMKAGDAFVGTGAEPVISTVSPGGFRSLTLSVPHSVIAPAVPRLDAMYGGVIPAANPALQMLSRYVGVLEDPDVSAVPELQATSVRHAQDLLTLALGATREGAVTAKLGGARAARLREIKAGIEQAIGREDISVGTIAARHRLPVRYVQRLFEADGVSFTEFVLGRRLARAHGLLTDRRFADLPISAIALEVGFANQPYFNRSFRARYGASPSELRAGGVQGASGAN